jgi:tetratricopeptide (TPR) repeat protein
MALSASPARAQSEAQNKQEAKEHYEKATRLYDLARYGDAIGEYEAAYLLVADPNLLYNMGQAYRLWDKPEEAIRCYKNYLRNRADASNRADVEKRIAELERTIEDRHRSGTASSAPSPPPVAAPAPPPVGEPPPVAIEVAAPAATLAQPAGAGGAGLVTSLVTGLAAANKAKQIADASKQPNHPVFDPSVQSAGKTLNAVAIVAGVTGLAAGGVGLYFYFRTRRASATAASVTSGTQAAFFPLAGPGFAGGGASVDF